MASDAVRGRVRVRVVRDNTAEVRGAIRRNAAANVAKAAQDILAHAQVNIRTWDLIDTGNMLNSVQVLAGATDLQKFVQVGAHYAIYHEMGTRHLPARPFLLPAAEAVAPSFHRAMAGLL